MICTLVWPDGRATEHEAADLGVAMDEHGLPPFRITLFRGTTRASVAGLEYNGDRQLVRVTYNVVEYNHRGCAA